MPVTVDPIIHPELAERELRIAAAHAITNRLAVLADLVVAKPGIPIIDGEPDKASWLAWQRCSIATSLAIEAIAQESQGLPEHLTS